MDKNHDFVSDLYHDEMAVLRCKNFCPICGEAKSNDKELCYICSNEYQILGELKEVENE